MGIRRDRPENVSTRQMELDARLGEFEFVVAGFAVICLPLVVFHLAKRSGVPVNDRMPNLVLLPSVSRTPTQPREKLRLESFRPGVAVRSHRLPFLPAQLAVGFNKKAA